MKIALISCMIFSRHVAYLTVHSKNVVHTFFIEQGLHDTPKKLQEQLQATINKIEKMQKETPIARPKFDAIVLAYGLCSNGIVGLHSETIPLIAPRCDDCMALFTGSQKRYLEVFNSRKGIYWFNKAWVEQGALPTQQKYDLKYKTYCDMYDEDTADYLMEVEEDWKDKYESVCFIKSSIFADENEQELTKQVAQDYSWEFFTTEENMEFLKDLIEGNWTDETRFLRCPAGNKIVEDFTGNKIKTLAERK